MKSKIIKIIAFVAITLALGSCSNDNDETTAGEGKLGVEFDNVFGSSNLILNTQNNVTSQNETLKISDIKYIISNIVLTKEDGTTFIYPKSKSYFVIDENNSEAHEIELENIPADDYTKIKFGIGVDKAQFDLGASGQGDFLTIADKAGMLWSWSAGYKFVLFEGTFTSASVTTPTSFMVHTGQTGTDYNYTEVTLDLPTKALVRTNITPDIHIFADVAKIIDGRNKIKLSDYNEGGMGAMIMGGTNLPLITANLSNMFTVMHVHND
ncbi:MbnP family protein [Flavobacterium sp.]|uniref:MbnP family protein n=1 Tax=Flavobacterium sp. TaxID=239 RepID=UPI002CC48DEA|nr:MbnP family protein [Flavobacterium sp.]HSD08745.1 MbnP family protein [Flavobacterium sp.]